MRPNTRTFLIPKEADLLLSIAPVAVRGRDSTALETTPPESSGIFRLKALKPRFIDAQTATKEALNLDFIVIDDTGKQRAATEKG